MQSTNFSEWMYDAASGWSSSPDGVWKYNTTTFVFFHSRADKYFTFDAPSGTYVQVECGYTADGPSPSLTAPPLT